MKWTCMHCRTTVCGTDTINVKEDLQAKEENEKLRIQQRKDYEQQITREKYFLKVVADHNNAIHEIPIKFMGITYDYKDSDEKYFIDIDFHYGQYMAVKKPGGYIVRENGKLLENSFRIQYPRRYKYIECPVCKNKEYID